MATLLAAIVTLLIPPISYQQHEPPPTQLVKTRRVQGPYSNGTPETVHVVSRMVGNAHMINMYKTRERQRQSWYAENRSAFVITGT